MRFGVVGKAGLRLQRRGVLIQASFLLFMGVAAHAQDSNTIYWTEGAKLQLADFRGTRGPGYIGKTAATIVPTVRYSKDSFYYKIDCVFDKSNSVIKGRSLSVLEHEQGHFDITEIVARQIRKNLSALSAKAGITDSVNRIVETGYAEGDRIQQAYEADCGYGDVPLRQEAWNKRIKQMLDELKDHNKSEGAVKMEL